MPLQPPPYDQHGEVIPHDHVGIRDNDGIIRRVSEQQVVEDRKTGGRRLSSMVFKSSSLANAGMSVDLQAQIEELGIDAQTYVTTPRWLASVRFEAGPLREEDYSVGFDPLEENPHHGEVWGTFSKSKQKRLLQLCEWFVEMEGVSIG